MGQRFFQMSLSGEKTKGPAAKMTKRSPALQRQNASRFSLIELLVVAAIVAVLAGMLLPALHRARSTARNILCTSRQKGLYVYFSLYASSYEGYWLSQMSGLVTEPSWLNIKNGNWVPVLGTGVYYGYAGSGIAPFSGIGVLGKKVPELLCSTAEEIFPWKRQSDYYTSYGITQCASNETAIAYWKSPIRADGEVGVFLGSSVRNPSAMLYLACSGNWMRRDWFATWHNPGNTRGIAAFLDGHAASVDCGISPLAENLRTAEYEGKTYHYVISDAGIPPWKIY